MRYLLCLILGTLISVPVLAKDKPTLTVYSYESFLSQWGAGEKIKAGFEQICDCSVDIIGVGSGVTLLNRLRFEGDKTKADIILGIDTNLLTSAQKYDLVQPHQVQKPNNLAIDWWNDEFVPYDYGYFAFIYDTDKITSPPKSFKHLLNNSNNWKIVYQDPRTSTPGLGLLLWINKVYGSDADQAWQQLSEKTLTVTKGWSESYSLFVKNEADFMLSYSSSPVPSIINNQSPKYQAAIFDEGHYQQIELAAITKYSKQVELANQFLAYLLTAEAQLEFVDKNIMYPIINIALPNAYDSLIPVTKSLSFSPEDVFLNQKKWIKQWQHSVSQ